MLRKIVAPVLIALAFAVPLPLASQVPMIDIYVTPFYDSEGPQVNVGTYSRQLASADRESILEVTGAMEREFASLSVEAMYVAAIRLYDFGHRDEAVRWFYHAQYRARLFSEVLDPRRIGHMGSTAFELRAAYVAFHQSSGEHINGYAGCDIDKWAAVLERVRTESQAVPDFARIYPSVAFIPAARWPSSNAELGEELGEFAEYVRAHKSEFKTGRAENNADARFCGER